MLKSGIHRRRAEREYIRPSPSPAIERVGTLASWHYPKPYSRVMNTSIEKHQHDWVRKALEAVYARDSSAIDEALAEMQAASAAREDW